MSQTYMKNEKRSFVVKQKIPDFIRYSEPRTGRSVRKPEGKEVNPIDQNFDLGTRHGGWPGALDGRFGRPTLGIGPAVRRGLERALATLELWRRRTRERHALLSLDDHILRDVGLTRREVELEGRKPFWRA